MKNYLFLLAFLFVSATVFAVPQGDGSVDNPYLVADASELNEIRNHPDAHYRLMNDIDLGDWLAENQWFHRFFGRQRFCRFRFLDQPSFHRQGGFVRQHLWRHNQAFGLVDGRRERRCRQ